MQVWNALHAARCKYRTQKIKKSLSRPHRTTLLGHIFATKACIDNRKKLVKQQYLLHMSYGELRPTNGWDRFGSLGHRYKFQLVLRLGSVTARHLVVGVSWVSAFSVILYIGNWYHMVIYVGFVIVWQHCQFYPHLQLLAHHLTAGILLSDGLSGWPTSQELVLDQWLATHCRV